MKIDTFLTAYDPSDLPGTSIDPLGFEVGYLFLAEKILPGLTNVANRPRYFSMLCAGAYMAGDLHSESLQTQYKKRLDLITRFERFWALANVLAYNDGGYTDLSGLRGITYATAIGESINTNQDTQVDADYKLLSRQVQYGGIGMYGAVADRMRLFDRQIFELSPDLGEKLAKGFIKESGLPLALRRAVEADISINVDLLTSWGHRAHISENPGKTEASCLRDALHLDPVRSRMTELLARFPEMENDTELERLSRIHTAIGSNGQNRDLKEAINIILCYEESYRLILLAFERLLWLCRQNSSPAVSNNILENDPVIEKVRTKLPKGVNNLLNGMENCETEHSNKNLNRLDDVKDFLQNAKDACGNSLNLVERIMTRHRDVQSGKFDRGRRKMPWLEYVQNNKISLTTTRVGGLGREVKDHNKITPHPYRLNSADALYKASSL